MKTMYDVRSAAIQELDEDELELISAGESACIADYCCYTVYRHPDEEDKDSACLMDFRCVTIAHSCSMVVL